MISATSTIPAVMAGAADTVGQFGGLITLVVGIGLGLFVVTWVIAKVKSAKRG